MTQYKNARIFTPDGYVTGGFEVHGGRFIKIFRENTNVRDAIDLRGAKVLPGLIDIHTHGCVGCDFSDGDLSGLRKIAAYEASVGVTSFLPTSMSLSYEMLIKAFQTARAAGDERYPGEARVLGIDMEGPFCSESKKGAQNPEYLKAPDINAFRDLNYKSGNLIKIVTVAPELPNALEFIQEASQDCTLSIAHTDCNYDQAALAISAGVTHLTHLYNAMPSIHHRGPGPIPACSESGQVYAELICDGIHCHSSAVRLAFKLFPERVCLISDSMRACGLPEGESELGGQRVFIKGHKATLADGTIAGSATNLYDCLRLAIAFGIPENVAIRAATLNPARSIGLEGEVGSIAPGKFADFLICDGDLRVHEVYISGNQTRKEN